MLRKVHSFMAKIIIFSHTALIINQNFVILYQNPKRKLLRYEAKQRLASMESQLYVVSISLTKPSTL